MARALVRDQFIVRVVPAVASCTGAAVGDTTPGTLSLTPLTESIGIRAAFTGDASATMTADIQYAVSGSGNWHEATTPIYAPGFIDLRATVGGSGVFQTNPYVNQVRWMVISLAQATAYDVKVTFTEGGQSSCVQGTTTTQTITPPSGSATARAITDNTTQAAALAAMNPGDTLTWSAAFGTYNNFTISRSGTAGAWITLDGNGATINGGAGAPTCTPSTSAGCILQNIALNANFIVLKNFTLAPSDLHGIQVGSAQHDFVIQNNTIQDVGHSCSAGNAATWNCSTGGSFNNQCEVNGIKVQGSQSNGFLYGNAITTVSLPTCRQASSSFDNPGEGISFSNPRGLVIADNTVTGTFRDGITADDSDDTPQDVALLRNTVTNQIDDGLEVKGDNVNVLVLENYVGSTGGNTFFSNESTQASGAGHHWFGPAIYARNRGRITGQIGGGGVCQFKGPSAPTWFLHNSGVVTGVGASAAWSASCGDPSSGSGPYVAINNATTTTGSTTEGYQPGLLDYNINIPDGGNYAFNWSTLGSKTHAGLVALGFDTHSIISDPLFADAQLNLQTTSPGIDQGVLLNMFNTAESRWPFLGLGPDMGALEKR
jgi:copper-binding protein NosD